jgi:transposase-like protein
MYREEIPYSMRRDEVEFGGSSCPRCGSYLETNRSRKGLLFSCAHCGYYFEEEDRPKMALG